MSTFITRSLLAGCCLALPLSVTASATASDEWTTRIAFYGWGTNLDTTVSHPNLPSVSVDRSFSDILKTIDFAAMGMVEARNRDFGLLLDGMYVQMSDRASLQNSPLSANLKMDLTTLMLAGQYRISETPTSYADLVLGVRGWSVKTDITIEPFAIQDKRSKQWADLMIGAKGTYDLNQDWFVSWSAMVGGFDLASNWVNDLHVGVGYRINENSAVQLGYRYMNVDYNQGNFDIDTKLGGLVLGVDYRF
ncbi:MAG: hypothetical protein LRY63_13500 [Nitrincola sp.]|nr:hypothetical protein [Nitrincola sp.]